jgi:hypothetical protein
VTQCPIALMFKDAQDPHWRTVGEDWLQDGRISKAHELRARYHCFVCHLPGHVGIGVRDKADQSFSRSDLYAQGCSLRRGSVIRPGYRAQKAFLAVAPKTITTDAAETSRTRSRYRFVHSLMARGTQASFRDLQWTTSDSA